MGKIVYHGTVGDKPPHTYGAPFHAGTLQAARERVDEELVHGLYFEEPTKVTATYHAYELGEDAPMSRRTWEDPMHPSDWNKAVPEHKENRIYPYTNAIEDSGSTSFVIPSSFVGRHVKHLGPQFTETHDWEP